MTAEYECVKKEKQHWHKFLDALTSTNINSKSIRTIITEPVDVKMEEYNVLGETCVSLIYSEHSIS